jgi:DNA topoisomerase III
LFTRRIIKVILTEKPSVARDIAKCLNINNKRDGYFEGNAYDPDQFMTDIIQFTKKITNESTKPLYDESKLGDCPLCHHPIIEGRQGYGCSTWKTGCKFVLWKQVYGATITRKMACQLLQTGRTLNAYAIKVNDEVFNAQFTLNALGATGYNKQQNQQAQNVTDALADCPLCKGKIVETLKAYSCSERHNGCKAVIWKTIAHKKITPAMANKLLSKGETGVLKGFKSAKGTAFEANLKLFDGKVVMYFAAH